MSGQRFGIFLLLFLLSVLLVGFPQVNAQSDDTSDSTSIIGVVPSGANMRAAPNSSATVLVSIPAGEPVTVLAYTRGSQVNLNGVSTDIWYMLHYGDTDNPIEGFIWSGLVSVPDDADIPTRTEYEAFIFHIEPNTTVIVHGHTAEEAAYAEQICRASNELIISSGFDLASRGEMTAFIVRDREEQVRIVADYLDISISSALYAVGADEGAGATKNLQFPGTTFRWSGQFICSSGYGLPVGNSCVVGCGEYFGAVFIELSERDANNPPDGGYGWWLDAFGDYLEAHVLEISGLELAAERFRFEWEGAWSGPHGCHLTLDSIVGACEDARHTLGPVAVEYLLSITGNDPAMIFEFFARISEYPQGGTYWFAAFEDVFGMTFDEFFSRLHEARPEYYSLRLTAENIPHLMAGGSGVVLDAEGVGVRGVWIWSCPIHLPDDCRRIMSGFWSEAPGFFKFGFPRSELDATAEVVIAVGSTPLPSSIFGYLSATGEYVPNRTTDGELLVSGDCCGDVGIVALGNFTTDRAEAETNPLRIEDEPIGIVIQLPSEIDIYEMLPVNCEWVGENEFGQQVDVALCILKDNELYLSD